MFCESLEFYRVTPKIRRLGCTTTFTRWLELGYLHQDHCFVAKEVSYFRCARVQDFEKETPPDGKLMTGEKGYIYLSETVGVVIFSQEIALFILLFFMASLRCLSLPPKKTFMGIR